MIRTLLLAALVVLVAAKVEQESCFNAIFKNRCCRHNAIVNKTLNPRFNRECPRNEGDASVDQCVELTGCQYTAPPIADDVPAFLLGNWEGLGIGIFDTYNNFTFDMTLDFEFVNRGLLRFVKVECDNYADVDDPFGRFMAGDPIEFFKGYIYLIDSPRYIEGNFIVASGLQEADNGFIDFSVPEVVLDGDRMSFGSDNHPLVRDVTQTKYSFRLNPDGTLRFEFWMATEITPFQIHLLAENMELFTE